MKSWLKKATSFLIVLCLMIPSMALGSGIPENYQEIWQQIMAQEEQKRQEELAKLQGMKIYVEAHAIQAIGFDDADAAWIAFDQQHP